MEQRNLLKRLADEPERCVRAFDWFGSYMLEELVEGGEERADAADACGGGGEPRNGDAIEAAAAADLPTFADGEGRVTYVDHVDARGAVPPSERRRGAPRTARRARARLHAVDTNDL